MSVVLLREVFIAVILTWHTESQIGQQIFCCDERQGSHWKWAQESLKNSRKARESGGPVDRCREASQGPDGNFFSFLLTKTSSKKILDCSWEGSTDPKEVLRDSQRKARAPRERQSRTSSTAGRRTKACPRGKLDLVYPSVMNILIIVFFS